MKCKTDDNRTPLNRERQREETAGCGKVWLVGAGPGDPGLMTLNAWRAIEAADVILVDKLVSREIIDSLPQATPRIDVGKRKNNHSCTQAYINALLQAKAEAGLNVCRLKGGDPFVFGRGGEEMLHLRATGIPVEVIPGITAAAGCTAAAGIALTHRGMAQGCTLVTAHAEKQLAIDWYGLAQLDHTLVFYMGLSKTGMISTRLINAGLSPATPVALVEKGCTPSQRLVTGRLDQLPQLAIEHQVKAPALIVVGHVVTMADELGQLLNQPDTASSLSA